MTIGSPPLNGPLSGNNSMTGDGVFVERRGGLVSGRARPRGGERVAVRRRRALFFAARESFFWFLVNAVPSPTAVVSISVQALGGFCSVSGYIPFEVASSPKSIPDVLERVLGSRTDVGLWKYESESLAKPLLVIHDIRRFRMGEAWRPERSVNLAFLDPPDGVR